MSTYLIQRWLLLVLVSCIASDNLLRKLNLPHLVRQSHHFKREFLKTKTIKETVQTDLMRNRQSK